MLQVIYGDVFIYLLDQRQMDVPTNITTVNTYRPSTMTVNLVRVKMDRQQVLVKRREMASGPFEGRNTF